MLGLPNPGPIFPSSPVTKKVIPYPATNTQKGLLRIFLNWSAENPTSQTPENWQVQPNTFNYSFVSILYDGILNDIQYIHM